MTDFEHLINTLVNFGFDILFPHLIILSFCSFSTSSSSNPLLPLQRLLLLPRTHFLPPSPPTLIIIVDNLLLSFLFLFLSFSRLCLLFSFSSHLYSLNIQKILSNLANNIPLMLSIDL